MFGIDLCGTIAPKTGLLPQFAADFRGHGETDGRLTAAGGLCPVEAKELCPEVKIGWGFVYEPAGLREEIAVRRSVNS